MLLAEVHYQDKRAQDSLCAALVAGFSAIEPDPMFVCIGSDRHLLDCFGPLTGTMLKVQSPGLLLCGTLEKPLHAQNLLPGLKEARQLYGSRMIVAIDASAGKEEEIGLLRIKRGGLVPGKALAKNLPTVGQLAITGVVEVSLSQGGIRKHRHPRLALVYNMAALLSSAISEWHKSQYLA
jgi:putative sporulation protein YyaC